MGFAFKTKGGPTGPFCLSWDNAMRHAQWNDPCHIRGVTSVIPYGILHGMRRSTAKKIRDKDTPLTPREKRFVEAYLRNGGNATQAAKAAGYNGEDTSLAVMGSIVLRRLNVRQAIDIASEFDPGIADRRERLHYWSALMRDITSAHKDRLKASEILAKVFRDYDDMPVGVGRTEVDLTKLTPEQFDEYCRLSRIAAGKPPLTRPANDSSISATEILDTITHTIGANDATKDESQKEAPLSSGQDPAAKPPG